MIGKMQIYLFYCKSFDLQTRTTRIAPLKGVNPCALNLARTTPANVALARRPIAEGLPSSGGCIYRKWKWKCSECSQSKSKCTQFKTSATHALPDSPGLR